jgi:hypothetical protein
MDRLPNILEDIYRVDPDLQSQDSAVRVLVAELLAKQPLVVPDAAFAARLRSELVTAKTVASPRQSVPSPWYFYAAPAGVFALMLLMLVPQFVTSPTVPAAVPEVVDSTDTIPEATTDTLYRTAPTEEVLDAPMGGSASMKSMSGGAPEIDPAFQGDMSLMAMPMSDEPMNSLYVSPQRPGNTVAVESVYATVPALVVIYRGATVVGVSDPVAPGAMTSATVVLREPTKEGEEATAVLYADSNGDSIFTPGVDMVLTDPYGTPIEQFIIFTNRPL